MILILSIFFIELVSILRCPTSNFKKIILFCCAFFVILLLNRSIVINRITWSKIRENFAKFTSNDSADLIFESLEIIDNEKEKKFILSADTLTFLLLSENNFNLFNILCDVIKNSIKTRNWDLWEISLEEYSYESDKKASVSDRTNRYALSNLQKNFTFENYFSKADNFAILEASRLCINGFKNKDLKANSLFIWGNSGYGKTHIVNAIGNELFNNNDNINILYVTGNKFVDDFTSSFTGGMNNLDKFNKTYSNLDVLIIDDFQQLEDKKSTLDQFFSIYDEMIMRNKLVIFAADKKVDEILISDRISSRIKSGLIYQVRKPDIDTKIEIFKYHANLTIPGLEFEEAAIDIITRNFDSPREIIGIITQILVDNITKKYDYFDLNRAQSILHQTVMRKSIDQKEIINIICEYFNVSQTNVLKPGTRGTNQLAGDFIVFFLKDRLDYSQKKIASLFGLKDHSAISKRLQKFENEVKVSHYQDFQFILRKIEEI